MSPLVKPRRVVPRLPLHAYGDVDRLHRGLPASWVRHAAIVRATGAVSRESIMADGYPSRGDRNAPLPAPIRKDGTHGAVRHGCHLGSRVRVLHVFLLLPLKFEIVNPRASLCRLVAWFDPSRQ